MTTTCYVFDGYATHEDDLDGLDRYILISDDCPQGIKDEALEDADEAIVQVTSRSEVELLVKAIDEKRDFHSLGTLGNGYIIDLNEPYVVTK